jgi:hypothetical protein
MGELRKLGINMAKSTVEKYCPRIHKPPSPTWKAFLNNHIKDLVACGFFTVPTATFRVLFVFIMLAHERRRIVHVNVTSTQPPSGPLSRSSRLFRGMRRRGICSATATASTGKLFNSVSRTWASKR